MQEESVRKIQARMHGQQNERPNGFRGQAKKNPRSRPLFEPCLAWRGLLGLVQVLLDTETARLGSEDHSRLLGQENLHKALLGCCLEVRMCVSCEV